MDVETVHLDTEQLHAAHMAVMDRAHRLVQHMVVEIALLHTELLLAQL